MSKINDLIRTHIKQLVPYSSARDDFKGTAQVFLDANESAYEIEYAPGLNRYPDSRHRELRSLIAARNAVGEDNIILGNGSDEIIDLLIRCFCEPGQDGILIFPPTYGMYKVLADSHAVKVNSVLLTETFGFPEINNDFAQVKITFLCRPNNPTGNLLFGAEQGREVLSQLPGIIVVDEAYIDFCPKDTLAALLEDYEQLVIIRTFSKAWGLAGLRAGYAIANPEVIAALQKLKLPYNLNVVTQNTLQRVLEQPNSLDPVVTVVAEEREKLVNRLNTSPIVQEVFPSCTNFVLARFTDAQAQYEQFLSRGVVVRSRVREQLCQNCLRITIGSPVENAFFVSALEGIEKKWREK